MRPLLVGLVGACAAPVAAQDDPILVALDKAKVAHGDTVAKARSALIAALDEAIKAVAESGDLDGVKALRAEAKAFEDAGKLPTAARLRTKVGEYQKATKASLTALEKAFDQAVRDSTKALKIEQAEAIRTQWQEVFAQGTGKPASGAGPPNPGPGSVAGAAAGKFVPGTYTVRYTNNHVRTYVVTSSGELQSPDDSKRDKLKPVPGSASFWIDFGDDKSERITFADGRMFVEHFNPSADRGKNPPTYIGIGEPVRRK
jgi:hypothetical protein